MHHPQFLIVDRDDHVRSELRGFVQLAFPAARIADYSSAEHALEDIGINGADLLITDCKMPGMDGPMLVRKLRAQKLMLPIIMMSGASDARPLGEAAGINHFIEKRYLEIDLPGAIRRLLNACGFRDHAMRRPVALRRKASPYPLFGDESGTAPIIRHEQYAHL